MLYADEDVGCLSHITVPGTGYRRDRESVETMEFGEERDERGLKGDATSGSVWLLGKRRGGEGAV